MFPEEDALIVYRGDRAERRDFRSARNAFEAQAARTSGTKVQILRKKAIIGLQVVCWPARAKGEPFIGREPRQAARFIAGIQRWPLGWQTTGRSL